jgi:hypothetical protein
MEHATGANGNAIVWESLRRQERTQNCENAVCVMAPGADKAHGHRTTAVW